jgi:hypothetical protein
MLENHSEQMFYYYCSRCFGGRGGFGEKSTLFNPKINQWVRWKSTRESTKRGGERGSLLRWGKVLDMDDVY